MEGGSVLRGLSGRILKANLLTVLLFAAIWLAVILYYKSQNDRADAIRLAADHVDIELLECRRAEKDFILRDLTAPAFFEAAVSESNAVVRGTNLEKWEPRLANVRQEAAKLKELIGNDDEFDLKAVRNLDRHVEDYAKGFRSLVVAYHTLGFRDYGLEGRMRKAGQELEAAIAAASDAPLKTLVVELRRDEIEYLSLNEEKVSEKVRRDLAAIAERLKSVPGRGDVGEKLAQTEAAFEAVVSMQSRIGATADKGLQAEMRTAVHQLDAGLLGTLERAVSIDDKYAGHFVWMLVIGGILGFAVAGTIGVLIGGRVARPIAELAITCQSAAAELQAAANQQATGTKEQATSMNEISTTINELLASSRQIAESARRVAQIAEHAGSAARSGDQTVHRSNDSISGIRKQVDLIVAHMLDLGKKSQQIGGVLEIINELAEQTNILAINATIEAAGGGESGKRFGVVADEIRKLADRVSGSTKEIRGLVEDVRSAVNATVMTTETGSKAVDAGAAQFGEVTAAFKQIVSLVGTNTEAGREIELTTKQQATAVEQVNAGVLSVGQATREMEASTAQTFQTATQLANVARDLSKLVSASTNGAA
jgi:methyl-accepting chemotaxis protein